LFLILFITVVSLNATNNNDWPMFRHDPHHTGYIDCEMPDEIETSWKYKTDDKIYSSPTIADDKVYVGSQDNYIY